MDLCQCIKLSSYMLVFDYPSKIYLSNYVSFSLQQKYIIPNEGQKVVYTIIKET